MSYMEKIKNLPTSLEKKFIDLLFLFSHKSVHFIVILNKLSLHRPYWYLLTWFLFLKREKCRFWDVRFNVRRGFYKIYLI